MYILSENMIAPVSAASKDVPPQIRQEAVAPAKTEYTKETEGAAWGAPPEEIKTQVEPKATKPISNSQFTDVHLKFQVDSETKEITVLVLDKISKEIIRTIPSEEIANLRAGDLFELFM